MEVPLYDVDSIEPMGKYEIPDEIVEAADKVRTWLDKHPGFIIHGLKLED